MIFTATMIYHENFSPKFVHLDNNVVFSHAGIFQEFINSRGLHCYKTAKELVEKINSLDLLSLWQDDSPLWARPQYDNLTSPAILNGFLQVVGHTPVKEVIKDSSIISTDVFSTNWGKKIGSEKMIVVGTINASFEVINIDYRKEFGEER